MGDLAVAGLRALSADLEPYCQDLDGLSCWRTVRCHSPWPDIAIAMPLSYAADRRLLAFRQACGRTFSAAPPSVSFIGNFWLMSSAWLTLAFAPSGEVNVAAGTGRCRVGYSAAAAFCSTNRKNAFADIHSAAVSSGIPVAPESRASGTRHRRHLHADRTAGAIGAIPEFPAADRLGVCAASFGVVLVDHFILRKRRGRSHQPRCAGRRCWRGWGVSTHHLLANLYPDIGYPAGAGAGRAAAICARSGLQLRLKQLRLENAVQTWIRDLQFDVAQRVRRRWCSPYLRITPP